MLQLRKISALIMLLLFAFALSGDALIEYMCGCQHIEQHSCCSCPSHHDECENHREVATHNCSHDSSTLLFGEAIISPTSQISSELYAKRVLELFIVDIEDVTSYKELAQSGYKPQNQHIDSQWCALSAPLRAPPVLI